MRFFCQLMIFSATAALLLSCDKPGATDSVNPATAARTVTGAGIVRGKITFDGTPPTMKGIPNDNCCEGAGPLKEETVIVGADKGLANCLVWIEGIGPASPRNETPVLDQVFCQYVPHVIGLVAGQKLQVRSSDDTIHNVNFKGKKNAQLNFGMTIAGDMEQVAFGSVEIIPVQCDVHPWMIAYAGVFENSYFAVTKPDGVFEITDIPTGTYKLMLWHELYGRKEQPITVGDDRPLTVDFTYSANR